MKNIKYIYSLFLAFIVTVSIAMPAASLAAKDRAPDFDMKTLEGGNINLSDYNGKYVLLNFWATWCGPCKIEMPSMEALFKKFKSKNFEILAISNDIFGAKVVKPFVEAHNMSFTVLLDQDLKVSSRYEVMSLPTTFLIDPKGTIIGVINGAQEWDHPETLQYFENLLNKN